MFASVALLAVWSAAIGATASESSLPAPFAVACGDIADPGPVPGKDGYRLVLGVVAVPPVYQAQGAVHVNGYGRWTYWHKSGVGVRAGKFAVTVTVPSAWRSRVAISWGNSHNIVTSLGFSGCGPGPAWNGYAGGFYLRTPSACVSLVFSAGHRSTTIRFGIGRRCP
jgi:hypothetical protein